MTTTKTDIEDYNTLAFYINNSGSIQTQAKYAIQPTAKRNEDIMSIALHFDKAKDTVQKNQQSSKKKLIKDPQEIYCESVIKKSKSTMIEEVKLKENRVNLITFLFALNSLWNSLPLAYNNIEIVGKTNIFSKNFLKNHIIQPLKQGNPSVQEEHIQKSKVIACCENLIKKIRKVGLSTTLITILWISISFIGEFIFIRSLSDEQSYQNFIIYSYIASCLLFLIYQTLVLIGLSKCQSRYLICSLTTSFLNILYQIFITAFSLYYNSTKNQSEQNLIGIHVWVSISSVFISFFLLICASQANSSLKRLFVLVKSINPSEIPKGWLF